MVHLVFMGITSHLVWWCYVQWFSHASIYFGFLHNYVYQRLCGNLLENAGDDWRGPAKEYMGLFENGQVSKLANHHD